MTPKRLKQMKNACREGAPVYGVEQEVFRLRLMLRELLLEHGKLQKKYEVERQAVKALS